jgi:hypothetical protein
MAAELLKRYFHSEITALLFPDDGFLVHAKNDSAFVNNNSVELPHSGTIPAVTVDRSSFPGTITQRTDVATQYLLNELSTDPTHLQDSEGLIVAYNKRASILDQHAKSLNEKGSNRALYSWAAAGAPNILTTGSDRATTSPSATGTRKQLAKQQIIDANAQMNRDEVPVSNRHIIVPSDMYSDLLAIDEFVRADAFGTSNIPTGMIGRVFGFTVWMRSSTVVMTGTTIKAEGAAGAAADNQAAICWHPDFVRKAIGAHKVFVEVGKADMYGDVMSALVRTGFLRARNDDKGVVTISEQA